MGKLLTRKETASLFKVTVRTIDNWTKQGVLTPVKIGGRVLFSKEDLKGLYNPLNTSNDEQ